MVAFPSFCFSKPKPKKLKTTENQKKVENDNNPKTSPFTEALLDPNLSTWTNLLQHKSDWDVSPICDTLELQDSLQSRLAESMSATAAQHHQHLRFPRTSVKESHLGRDVAAAEGVYSTETRRND